MFKLFDHFEVAPVQLEPLSTFAKLSAGFMGSAFVALGCALIYFSYRNHQAALRNEALLNSTFQLGRDLARSREELIEQSSQSDRMMEHLLESVAVIEAKNQKIQTRKG